jgi:outer membrane protein assembly factor BamA
MAGVSTTLVLDGRDSPGFASKGGYLSVTASAFPKAWDVKEAMGRVQGEGSFTLAPQGSWRPSLTLFAGGIKTFGTVPFFESAQLGGSRTLRGYRPNRFAGDAAVYGSAEVRLPLTRLQIVIPGEQGVFGFADAGRVYVKGETSDEMHSSFGGGIWLSFLSRANVLFVGAGVPKESKEGTRFIAGFGFPF